MFERARLRYGLVLTALCIWGGRVMAGAGGADEFGVAAAFDAVTGFLTGPLAGFVTVIGVVVAGSAFLVARSGLDERLGTLGSVAIGGGIMTAAVGIAAFMGFSGAVA